MLWFEGSVAEAISKVKREKKVFLVFIEGEDELSQQMSSTYNNIDVSGKLSNCIAIKLKAKSEPCQQFSQIYPVVVIPSSFFIGVDGIPLEIIAGSLEPNEFINKIDKTLKLHDEKCGDGGEPKNDHPPEVPVKSETAELNNAVTSTSQATEPASENASVAAESSACASISDDKMKGVTEDGLAESEGNNSDVALEEKLERAKELIELRRIQKEKEEQEKEKDSEMERRRAMKELQRARQQQQENDMKEWAQSRAREKEEERLARERVLAQIAQDRAERAARYQKEKAEELSKQQKALEERLKKEQEQAAIAAAQKSQYARIQFRMPDGSSVTHQFSSDATLQDLHSYVAREVSPPFSSFTFSTTFPRRQFQGPDYMETLRDLQLAPSATILVVPQERRISVPSHQNRNNWNFLWLLLAPLAMVWSFISSFLFGSPSQSVNSSSTTERPKRKQEKGGQARGASTSGSGSSGSESDQGTSRKRRSGDDPDSSFYRREGNIYRLSTRRNDDDDNNTWNGNSTQQM